MQFSSDKERERWEQFITELEQAHPEKKRLTPAQQEELWEMLEKTKKVTKGRISIETLFGHNKEVYDQTMKVLPIFMHDIKALFSTIAEKTGLGDELVLRAVTMGLFSAIVINMRGMKIAHEEITEAFSNSVALVTEFELAMQDGGINPWKLGETVEKLTKAPSKEATDGNPFAGLF